MDQIARLNIDCTGNNKKLDYQDISIVNWGKETLLSTLNIPSYYKDFIIDIDKKICDFFKNKGILLTNLPSNKVCIYPFYWSLWVAMYATDINAVLIPIAFSDQIKVIVHELIHYHSSDFANNALQENRISKTWFSSKYQNKRESLNQFNEWFTDFITNLFLETLIDKSNNIMDKRLIDRISLIQEDMQKFYSIIGWKDTWGIWKFFDKISLKKKFPKSFFEKNLLTFAFSPRIYSIKPFDYNYQYLDIWYPDQVQLVQEIIDGIKIVEKNDNIIDYFIKWYFTGNTHILRIIDCIYWKWFLKTISSLPDLHWFKKNFEEDKMKWASVIQYVQTINEWLLKKPSISCD